MDKKFIEIINNVLEKLESNNEDDYAHCAICDMMDSDGHQQVCTFEIYEELAKYCSLKQFDRVYDIGCTYGYQAYFFNELNIPYVGIERTKMDESLMYRPDWNMYLNRVYPCVLSPLEPTEDSIAVSRLCLGWNCYKFTDDCWQKTAEWLAKDFKTVLLHCSKDFVPEMEEYFNVKELTIGDEHWFLFKRKEKASRKTKWTTGELFDEVVKDLKKQGLYPESLLDYHSSKYETKCIETEEVSPMFKLNYGGSEGIYLDVYLQGRVSIDEEDEKITGMGIFKTLRTDDEAMHQMAKLEADFILSLSKYMNTHLDEFIWYGGDVRIIEDNDMSSMKGYLTCGSIDRAYEKAREYNEKHGNDGKTAIVRDNTSRIFYSADGNKINF